MGVTIAAVVWVVRLGIGLPRIYQYGGTGRKSPAAGKPQNNTAKSRPL